MKQKKKVSYIDIDRRNLSTEDFCSSVRDLVSLLEDEETASLLAKRCAPIFCELKNIKHKELMYEGFLYGVFGITDAKRKKTVMLGTDDTIKALKNLLPSFEKIQAAGLLKEAMDLSYYFWQLKQEKINFDKSFKTSKATWKHREESLKKWWPLLKGLEPYLQEANDKWHPRNEKEGIRSRSKMGIKRVSKIIFGKYRSEIGEKMKNWGIEAKDLEETFLKCFDVYLRYTDYNDNCRYIPKKRPPRNKASRKRSSEGAKKMWEKRKREMEEKK